MEKKKESRSGMEIMNLLQVGSSVKDQFSEEISLQHPFDEKFGILNRKRDVNVGHGMGKRLTMIFIK